MELNNLKKIKGNKAKRTPVGRGIGSGHGGHTAGKGSKGQKARTGNSIPRGFEGGQVPLHKKLPKIGGFKSFKKNKTVSVTFDAFKSITSSEVTPQDLVENGVIKKHKTAKVKIVNSGDLSRKITFKGFLYSQGAKEIILQSGGSIVD